MQKHHYLVLLILGFSLAGCQQQTQPLVSELGFNNDWLFYLGDVPDAEKPLFNDATWRKLSVPHDFSIEQAFSIDNASSTSGAYAHGGIGWYRKHFKLDKELKNQLITIYFDGVYRNSKVWINGHLLGERPYGYVPFQYPLTPYLHFGDTANIIAVRVNTSPQPNSRWYTGAGIYRNVKLHISDKTHLAPYGVFAHTRAANKEQASISIQTKLHTGTEHKQLTIINELLDATGRKVAEQRSTEKARTLESLAVTQELTVLQPSLWSPQSPYLYTLTTKVLNKDILLDEYTSAFGIRTVKFDADQGLLINGKKIKIKGTNNHHDGGPLGAACYPRTFERQIEILKSMGCNALRISHNPPALPLLELADKMGMLVFDEIFDEWEYAKRTHGYSPHFKEWHAKDIENWICRDRNHASVIAWSLGNEIPEQNSPKGAANFLMLKKVAVQFDSTRAFTAACNEIPDGNKHGYTEAMDIVGYNYREPHYADDHKTYPNRVIYGSETAIYPYQPGDGFPLHSYADWFLGQTAGFVAGEFLWTGFDYLGEAGIGAGGTGLEPWNYWPKWPWRSAYCGVIDLCGHPKPGYFFRKSLWVEEPMVYLAVQTDSTAQDPQAAPFWGWPAVEPHWDSNSLGDSLAVHIYTNCESVELFLNDESLGRTALDKSKEAFIFKKVAYKPGKLSAVGFHKNGHTTSFELNTAGKPTKLLLNPDRVVIPKGDKTLCYISAQLVDEAGVPVQFSDQNISFKLDGPATILAVGNGNPQDTTSFTDSMVKTFCGRCLVIVKTTGELGIIRLTADWNGEMNTEIEVL